MYKRMFQPPALHFTLVRFGCGTTLIGSKMILFQLVRKYFKRMGIYLQRPNQRNSSINCITFIYFTAFAQAIISSAAFILFEAETVVEYGFTFYVLTIACVASAAISIVHWNVGNIIAFVESFEAFIEKSKFNL